ncbi:hypothetical protein L9F63_010458 [Diploptera punctata]|uniref:Uncharacterized protein n=1 Tax=Diploptera punctata TaxID=6984 RepID=A0AAD8EQW1_DIPPU|nr:hypothetical protein L9F63_010458 [Diploptera punctata]
MSKNIGYHTLTNSTSESIINLDDELLQDIDFDFFDTKDSKDTSVPENNNVTQEIQKERKSNLKVNEIVLCCDENSSDVKTVESPVINESTGSTVRFSTSTKLDNVSKQAVSKQTRLKDLMNCIAYDENKEVDNDKIKSPSPDFLSLSTDTTSEITSVTTRPSSSGCSSMGKI